MPPPAIYEGSSFSTSSPTLTAAGLFTSGHYNGCVEAEYHVWICIFQMTTDAEYLFIYLIAIHVSYLVKYLLKSFTHF